MGIMVTLVLRWQGFPLMDLMHLGRAGWVIVPMLVGAAGNLINDYFDIREDRINKPDKALVGRTVKRRVIVVTHWGFTAAALICSGWLSSHTGAYWPMIMVAVFSVILYLYSPLLKGRGAWGNVAISGCVAGLVVWGGLAALKGTHAPPPALWMFAVILGWFNFLREWVKDVQDMEGDRAANHRTLAMSLTTQQNRFGVIVGIILGGSFVIIWSLQVNSSWLMMLPWLFAFCAALVSAIKLKTTSLSAWLKVLLGSLYLFIV